MAKVMTVEDSGLIRSIIRKIVADAGHDVVEVSSGKDAIIKYQTDQPDIVFMDINLPGISGIDAAEEILKSDPSAKIIMCTIVDKEEYKQKAKDIGAKGYIIKPFSRADILGALESNL